ncbi:flavodoxin domain-containing protein [Rhodococcus phenolicus]|uniref:flavodoxin domain-containing protein n=1 Tax=Rhodococcus phenolicus TaxID=263849 RepID=UPI0008305B84|nr:flavodoxin domain-containing protein [Rhodococcus phenolicus]
MRTLVGYATAKGSTRGIAERIAAALEQAGHTADLKNLASADTVREYDVLVVGSAIHNGQWLPGAADALDRLGPDLAGRTVWAFSVSSVGATSSLLSPRVARYLRRVTPEPQAMQTLRSAADVRRHRFFAGTISPGDWPGIGRVVFRLMGGHYGHARDWTDIDGWVAAVAAGSEDDAG